MVYSNTDGLLQRYFDYKNMDIYSCKKGVSFVEEPCPFMFLNVITQHLESAQEALLRIQEFISSDIVFGPYDSIRPLRAKDRVDFERIVSLIHKNVQELREYQLRL